MPIYEYECADCGHQFEAIQKMSDTPLVECPACHALSLKKLVSAVAFRLKGQGWYETDFKQDNKKQLASNDSGSSPSEQSSAKDSLSGASSVASDSGKTTPEAKPSASDSAASATKKDSKKTENTSASKSTE